MVTKLFTRNTAITLFVFVVLMSLFLPFSLAFAETGMDLIEELAIFQMRQASDASSLFSETLYADSAFNERDVIRPDYYAGHYVKDNVLHICFTGKSVERKNEIADLLEDYGDKVVFEERTFSQSELERYASELVSELERSECIVYASSVDGTVSSIVLSVSESSYDRALDILSRSAQVPGLNIEVEISEPIQLMSNTDLIAGTEVISRISTNEFHLTLSATGTYNGSNAFLTCGHDVKSSSTLYTSNNSVLGTASYVRFSDGKSGDFTIGTLSNSFSPMHKTKTGSSSSALWDGYMTTPAKNTIIRKYGVNGKYAYGKVTSTNNTVYYDDIGYSISGLVKVSLSSGTVQSGDSGSPCWTSDMKFCGVLCSSVTGYFYFTPYGTIRNAGFSVYSQHDGTYTYHNTSKHKNNCSLCGGYVYESHSGTWSDYNSTYHKKYCSICNQTIYEMHGDYYDESTGKCTKCGRTGSITVESLSILPLQQKISQANTPCFK